MAITSEIIGKLGGADVEQIPVGGTAGGIGVKNPLGTPVASNQTLVAILIYITDAPSRESNRPQLYIGDSMSDKLTLGQVTWVAVVDAGAEFGVYTNASSNTTFTGHVYMVKL